MKQNELVTKIIRDTGNRTDITSDVSAAISSAVKYYKRERFWFLETATAIVTSSSLATYPSPSDLGPQIDSLLIWLSGSKGPIERVGFQELNEKDDGLLRGAPSQWTYFGDKIRLYPIPDKTYTLEMSYHQYLDAPSITGSNAWTNAGAELIRFRAKWDVQAHILNDEVNAKETKASELEEYFAVMSDTTRRMSSGKIRKWGF